MLLLDVVLGHGAEPDPAAALAPAIAGVRPAGRGRASSAPTPTRRASTARSRALVDAGAEVHLSNAARHPPRRRAAREAPDEPRPTTVVTVGADLFADAVADQAVAVTRVDWRPPMPGTEADLATVAADPLRADANARALARDARRAGARWSTSLPASRGARPGAAASSCTPARRSPGTAPPARCAAR